MNTLPEHSCDVLIIGSGAAGLSLALRLAEHSSVIVLSKGPISEGSTFYAQGGIAAVFDETDSIDSHIEDTLIAGAGISVSPSSGTGDVTVSSTISPPTTGGTVADIGAWRIIVGTGGTATGYLDTVTMPKPLGAVLSIGVTEHDVVGWGPPGPNGEVTGTVTVFGTAPHPDADKFKLSVATWDIGQNKWVYPGLTSNPGGVSIQYIAIGENPDYVPPTPAP